MTNARHGHLGKARDRGIGTDVKQHLTAGELRISVPGVYHCIENHDCGRYRTIPPISEPTLGAGNLLRLEGGSISITLMNPIKTTNWHKLWSMRRELPWVESILPSSLRVILLALLINLFAHS